MAGSVYLDCPEILLTSIFVGEHLHDPFVPLLRSQHNEVLLNIMRLKSIEYKATSVPGVFRYCF